MKNIIPFLIILQLISCVSTKNIAETRNSDYRSRNNFELFKIWRELDIQRFDTDILNVKIALIPEGKTTSEFEADSQLILIHDSLTIMISDKMDGFNELEELYSDTSNTGKQQIYQDLKSDSSDLVFLEKIADDPYVELYEDILYRLRKTIQKSSFYSSQSNFESYLKNRSIEVVDMKLVYDIFGAELPSANSISNLHTNSLRSADIDFLIIFSGSYSVAYSDQAGSRIGSETMHLTLYDVDSAQLITTANLTSFWGSE
jgi:hypothetical protein